MREIVYIDNVTVVDGLSKEEEFRIIDLTMTGRERSLFHEQLKEMGYYVREGKTIDINEYGDKATIFGMFRLLENLRTDQKVGEITTSLGVRDEE